MPVSVLQFLAYPDFLLWIACCLDEWQSLLDRGTIRELVTSPPRGALVIPSKLVLDIKRLADGSIERYKARITARGDLQRPGSYEDTFAPVAGDCSLAILLNIALQLDLFLRHLDVKTAFLNSDLSHDIWISLPLNFDVDMLGKIQSSARGGVASSDSPSKGFNFPRPKMYAKLHKSLYGLKQAAMDWYKLQDSFLLNFDSRIKRSTVDAALYVIWTPDLKFLVSVHVDDYAVACSDMVYYEKFKKAFGTAFEIKEIGNLEFILQMKVSRTPNSISISQQLYIEDLADQYGLVDAKPKHTPFPANFKYDSVDFTKSNPEEWFPFRNLIGALFWLARKSRPDIFWYVVFLSQFLHCHDAVKWYLAKHVLKYLITTKHFVLKFTKASDGNLKLHAYCDSDWASNVLDRKSYSGYAVFMSGNLIAWGSTKQQSVTLSSAEAEYCAMSEVGKMVMHLIYLLDEFLNVEKPITIFCDNQGAIYISKKATNNKRSKHIDIRHHYIRDLIQKKILHVEYIATADNLADQLTKVVHKDTLRKFVNLSMKGA